MTLVAIPLACLTLHALAIPLAADEPVQHPRDDTANGLGGGGVVDHHHGSGTSPGGSQDHGC